MDASSSTTVASTSKQTLDDNSGQSAVRDSPVPSRTHSRRTQRNRANNSANSKDGPLQALRSGTRVRQPAVEIAPGASAPVSARKRVRIAPLPTPPRHHGYDDSGDEQSHTEHLSRAHPQPIADRSSTTAKTSAGGTSSSQLKQPQQRQPRSVYRRDERDKYVHDDADADDDYAQSHQHDRSDRDDEVDSFLKDQSQDQETAHDDTDSADENDADWYLDPSTLPANGPLRRERQLAALEIGHARAALYDAARDDMNFATLLWQWQHLVSHADSLEAAQEISQCQESGQHRTSPSLIHGSDALNGRNDSEDTVMAEPMDGSRPAPRRTSRFATRTQVGTPSDPMDDSRDETTPSRSHNLSESQDRPGQPPDAAVEPLPPAAWLEAVGYWPLPPEALKPRSVRQDVDPLPDLNDVVLSLIDRARCQHRHAQHPDRPTTKSDRPRRARSAYASGGPLAPGIMSVDATTTSTTNQTQNGQESDSDEDSSSVSSLPSSPEPLAAQPVLSALNTVVEDLVETLLPSGPTPALDILTLKALQVPNASSTTTASSSARTLTGRQFGARGVIGWQDVLRSVQQNLKFDPAIKQELAKRLESVYGPCDAVTPSQFRRSTNLERARVETGADKALAGTRRVRKRAVVKMTSRGIQKRNRAARDAEEEGVFDGLDNDDDDDDDDDGDGDGDDDYNDGMESMGTRTPYSRAQSRVSSPFTPGFSPFGHSEGGSGTGLRGESILLGDDVDVPLPELPSTAELEAEAREQRQVGLGLA